MDTASQSEITKLKKQVKDLGEGKVTSEADLNELGDAQALVDQ